MSSLSYALPPACHPNADWVAINQGCVSTTHTTAIAACTTCGAEWHLTLLARKITAPKLDRLAPGRTGRRGIRRQTADVDLAWRHARQLVASGWSVAAACAEAGIDRKSYAARAR